MAEEIPPDLAAAWADPNSGVHYAVLLRREFLAVTQGLSDDVVGQVGAVLHFMVNDEQQKVGAAQQLVYDSLRRVQGKKRRRVFREQSNVLCDYLMALDKEGPVGAVQQRTALHAWLVTKGRELEREQALSLSERWDPDEMQEAMTNGVNRLRQTVERDHVPSLHDVTDDFDCAQWGTVSQASIDPPASNGPNLYMLSPDHPDNDDFEAAMFQLGADGSSFLYREKNHAQTDLWAGGSAVFAVATQKFIQESQRRPTDEVLRESMAFGALLLGETLDAFSEGRLQAHIHRQAPDSIAELQTFLADHDAVCLFARECDAVLNPSFPRSTYEAYVRLQQYCWMLLRETEQKSPPDAASAASVHANLSTLTLGIASTLFTNRAKYAPIGLEGERWDNISEMKDAMERGRDVILAQRAGHPDAEFDAVDGRFSRTQWGDIDENGQQIPSFDQDGHNIYMFHQTDVSNQVSQIVGFAHFNGHDGAYALVSRARMTDVWSGIRLYETLGAQQYIREHSGEMSTESHQKNAAHRGEFVSLRAMEFASNRQIGGILQASGIEDYASLADLMTDYPRFMVFVRRCDALITGELPLSHTEAYERIYSYTSYFSHFLQDKDPDNGPEFESKKFQRVNDAARYFWENRESIEEREIRIEEDTTAMMTVIAALNGEAEYQFRANDKSGKTMSDYFDDVHAEQMPPIGSIADRQHRLMTFAHTPPPCCALSDVIPALNTNHLISSRVDCRELGEWCDTIADTLISIAFSDLTQSTSAERRDLWLSVRIAGMRLVDRIIEEEGGTGDHADTVRNLVLEALFFACDTAFLDIFTQYATDRFAWQTHESDLGHNGQIVAISAGMPDMGEVNPCSPMIESLWNRMGEYSGLMLDQYHVESARTTLKDLVVALDASGVQGIDVEGETDFLSTSCANVILTIVRRKQEDSPEGDRIVYTTGGGIQTRVIGLSRSTDTDGIRLHRGEGDASFIRGVSAQLTQAAQANPFSSGIVPPSFLGGIEPDPDAILASYAYSIESDPEEPFTEQMQQILTNGANGHIVLIDEGEMVYLVCSGTVSFGLQSTLGVQFNADGNERERILRSVGLTYPNGDESVETFTLARERVFVPEVTQEQKKLGALWYGIIDAALQGGDAADVSVDTTACVTAARERIDQKQSPEWDCAKLCADIERSMTPENCEAIVRYMVESGTEMSRAEVKDAPKWGISEIHTFIGTLATTIGDTAFAPDLWERLDDGQKRRHLYSCLGMVEILMDYPLRVYREKYGQGLDEKSKQVWIAIEKAFLHHILRWVPETALDMRTHLLDAFENRSPRERQVPDFPAEELVPTDRPALSLWANLQMIEQLLDAMSIRTPMDEERLLLQLGHAFRDVAKPQKGEWADRDTNTDLMILRAPRDENELPIIIQWNKDDRRWSVLYHDEVSPRKVGSAFANGSRVLMDGHLFARRRDNQWTAHTNALIPDRSDTRYTDRSRRCEERLGAVLRASMEEASAWDRVLHASGSQTVDPVLFLIDEKGKCFLGCAKKHASRVRQNQVRAYALNDTRKAELFASVEAEVTPDEWEVFEIVEKYEPKDQALLLDTTLEMIFDAADGAQQGDFRTNYAKREKVRNASQKTDPLAARQLTPVIEGLRAIKDFTAVTTYANRTLPSDEQTWNDYGVLDPNVRALYAPKHTVGIRRFVGSCIDAICGQSYSAEVLQRITPREYSKLLHGTKLIVMEFLERIPDIEPACADDLKSTIMMGVLRHCRETVPDRHGELLDAHERDWSLQDVLQQTDDQLVPHEGESTFRIDMARGRVAALREHAGGTASSVSSSTVFSATQLDAFFASSSAHETAVEGISRDDSVPHTNDTVLLATTRINGSGQSYIAYDPLRQRWTLATQRDGERSTMTQGMPRAQQQLSVNAEAAYVYSDGRVTSATLAHRQLEMLPSSQTDLGQRRASRIRGGVCDGQHILQELERRYSYVFNRKLLGPRLFVEDGDDLYFCCHRSFTDDADAMFMHPDDPDLLARVKQSSQDTWELLTLHEFAVSDEPSECPWIAYKLPEEMRAPAFIEPAFDASMGAGPQNVHVATLRRPGPRPGGPDRRRTLKVQPRCEILSTIAVKRGLDFKLKPEQTDLERPRFATSVADEITIPEDFHQGYWRAQLTDKVTGKILRLAICDMAGEVSFVVFDDPNIVPDEAFVGENAKEKLRRNYGAIVLRFDSEGDWERKVTAIVDDWFERDRRYYSLAHTEPISAGRPVPIGLYRPSVDRENVAELRDLRTVPRDAIVSAQRDALRNDLLHVAELVFGEATEENVRRLRPTHFEKLDLEEANLSFRGVQGGAGGGPFLQNAVVYLGLVTRRDFLNADGIMSGYPRESNAVGQAKYQPTIANRPGGYPRSRGLPHKKTAVDLQQLALDELRRIAFGSERDRSDEVDPDAIVQLRNAVGHGIDPGEVDRVRRGLRKHIWLETEEAAELRRMAQEDATLQSPDPANKTLFDCDADADIGHEEYARDAAGHLRAASGMVIPLRALMAQILSPMDRATDTDEEDSVTLAELAMRDPKEEEGEGLS